MELIDSEIWNQLESNERIFNCLNQAVFNTVSQSSMNQTIKAFLTAGFSKSVHYILRKLWKNVSNSYNVKKSLTSSEVSKTQTPTTV